MSSIDQILMPNETWSDRTELHWIIFFWPVVIALAITEFMFKQHFLFILNYPATALLIYFLAEALIRYVTTVYGVTNKRVILKKGWLLVKNWEMPISRIESVQMQQSFIGKMLGYGDVIVNGVGGDSLIFPTIDNPEKFRQKIFEEMEKVK